MVSSGVVEKFEEKSKSSFRVSLLLGRVK